MTLIAVPIASPDLRLLSAVGWLDRRTPAEHGTMAIELAIDEAWSAVLKTGAGETVDPPEPFAPLIVADAAMSLLPIELSAVRESRLRAIHDSDIPAALAAILHREAQEIAAIYAKHDRPLP